MKDFFNSPRTKKALKFLFWFLVWFWIVSFIFMLLAICAEQRYTYEVRGFFYITVFFAMVVSVVILAFFVKAEITWILWATVGYYFLFFGNLIYIPFYYLNPAYYKYQSECKKLPEPVIYNQDYWEAFTDDSKLKVVENGGGRYSAKLDKTFIATKWFKEDKVDEKETWWGNVRVAQRFYDGVHYATTTGYSYNGLVFRFGASKISFGYETLKCYNYKRK